MGWGSTAISPRYRGRRSIICCSAESRGPSRPSRRSEAIGRKSQPAPGGGTVRAPMPGLVVRIEVAEGQQVDAGAGLVVVEAMKMENELRAPRPGTVQTVHVAVGQAVEKGASLVTLASPEPSG